jgi:NAD(P)-dependent dehydrogenase (short-subunit alcohol dehydrogenase family)
LNTKRFQDKVALVTGGNSGIGRATALAFGREGAKVVIAARREKEGAEVVNEIKSKGGEALFVKTDLMVKGEIDNLFKTIQEKYGQLNYAFNNAGVWPTMKRAANYTLEEFDAVMNINVKAVWRCMQHEIPMMSNAGGAIVNCSSVAGWTGQEGTSLYTASKHAVIGLTRAAAVEFGRKNIRINAICPGITETPMVERQIAEGGEAVKKAMLDITPLGRFGKPEEIAGSVLFLCSDAASFITAKSIVVGGGQGIRA